MNNCRAEDALRIWSAQRDWPNLYKVYEIIREEAGGKANLQKNGWITTVDLASFENTANDFRTLGDSARHALVKSGKTPPATPMNFETAERVIGELLEAWLDSQI